MVFVAVACRWPSRGQAPTYRKIRGDRRRFGGAVTRRITSGRSGNICARSSTIKSGMSSNAIKPSALRRSGRASAGKARYWPRSRRKTALTTMTCGSAAGKTDAAVWYWGFAARINGLGSLILAAAGVMPRAAAFYFDKTQALSPAPTARSYCPRRFRRGLRPVRLSKNFSTFAQDQRRTPPIKYP